MWKTAFDREPGKLRSRPAKPGALRIGKKRLKIEDRSFAADFDRVVERGDKVVEPRRFFPMGTLARVHENNRFHALLFWHRACTAILIVRNMNILIAKGAPRE